MLAAPGEVLLTCCISVCHVLKMITLLLLCMLDIVQSLLLQLVMEEQRFATVMWGGFDFIADAGGSDPARREWLMECSGLQVKLRQAFSTQTCFCQSCCTLQCCY